MKVKDKDFLQETIKGSAAKIPTFSRLSAGRYTMRGGVYAVLVLSMIENGVDQGQGQSVLRQYRELRVRLTRQYRGLNPILRSLLVAEEMQAGFAIHLPWMDDYEHWSAYRDRRRASVSCALTELASHKGQMEISFKTRMLPVLVAMAEDLRYVFSLVGSDFDERDKEACDGYGHIRAYIKAVIAQVSLKHAFKSYPLPYFATAEELIEFFHQLVSSEAVCRQLYLNYFSETYIESESYYAKLAYNERLWDFVLELRRETYPIPTSSYLEAHNLHRLSNEVDTAPVFREMSPISSCTWDSVTFPAYW